jgi:hypothetical protein
MAGEECGAWVRRCKNRSPITTFDNLLVAATLFAASGVGCGGDSPDAMVALR